VIVVIDILICLNIFQVMIHVCMQMQGMQRESLFCV
jgi:hypothetical protein